MTRVTICLPVTSEVNYVRHAVRSVFAQSFYEWELVIVADGADQDVVDAISNITDPRVRVVIHHERLGLPTRLNEITLSASSPLVARMDGDDVMHPERLERQIAAWELHEPDVLGTGSYLINEAGRVQGSYREPALPGDAAGYLQSGVLSHPTVLMRTDWARLNLYDPTRVRTEDKELWLRTAKTSTHAKIPDRLLFCRVPTRLSTQKQALTARQDRRLLRDEGHLVAGRVQVAKAIAKSRLKQTTFGALSLTGLQNIAYRSKSCGLTDDELRAAQELLDRVVHTHVPGWNDAD